MVMQKAQLFSGTIRSNLLWGNPGATDEMLWAALETAQAAEFVQKKEKQHGWNRWSREDAICREVRNSV